MTTTFADMILNRFAEHVAQSGTPASRYEVLTDANGATFGTIERQADAIKRLCDAGLLEVSGTLDERFGIRYRLTASGWAKSGVKPRAAQPTAKHVPGIGAAQRNLNGRRIAKAG
jgi:hypothetical protein